MERRKIEEWFFKILMFISVFIVLLSLGTIFVTVAVKGFTQLTWEMLSQTPQGGFYIGKSGGILNAILGSLILGLGSTALALVVALPIAFYLNFYLVRGTNLPFGVRFSLDVLWGIPSVVYGAFGFSLMLFFHWPASLLMGMITIALLVLPIMVRSMDEVMRMIPLELMEAPLALGATRWEMASRVIVKQALPGIVTAVLMALGRGMSDAAAVLFTAGFTDSLPYSLFKPVATLPLAIFFQLGTPFPEVQARGYASAFVLTVLVLSLNIIARLISNFLSKHRIK